MSTELEIANEALSLLGECLITAGQLTTPDDKRSRLIFAFLSISRRAVLRDLAPNCARAYADLTTAGVQAHPDHGYAYALPSDCLRVLTVLSGTSSSLSTLSVGRPVVSRWRVLSGLEIALDEAEASIEFVKNVATTAYDGLTDEALAAYMAAKMALPLTESTRKRDEMDKLYASAKFLAMGGDEQEGDRDRFSDAERLQSARFGARIGGF